MRCALRVTPSEPQRRFLPGYSGRLHPGGPRAETQPEKPQHVEMPDDRSIDSPQALRTLETCLEATWHFETEGTSAAPKAEERGTVAPNPQMRLVPPEMNSFGVAAIPVR